MKVAVIGALGGTGREVVRLALGRGHEVRALVRDAGRLLETPGLTAVVGDVRDAGRVSELIAGADAVISAVGPTETDRTVCSAATENVLAAMREHRVRRYVLVSGGSATLPDDRKTLIDRLFDLVVRRAERGGLEDKERELALLARADVDWTAVRVPRLVDGPATGKMRVSLERLPARQGRRSDLAKLLVDQLEDRSYLRKAPFAGG
jgi:putative NADH-flavin reductase